MPFEIHQPFPSKKLGGATAEGTHTPPPYLARAILGTGLVYTYALLAEELSKSRTKKDQEGRHNAASTPASTF